MLQFLPDWSDICKPEQMTERYDLPFKYTKPGLYLTATDTFFIQVDDDGIFIHVHCWNVPIQQTTMVHAMPVQFDVRGGNNGR